MERRTQETRGRDGTIPLLGPTDWANFPSLPLCVPLRLAPFTSVLLSLQVPGVRREVSAIRSALLNLSNPSACHQAEQQRQNDRSNDSHKYRIDETTLACETDGTH